MSMGVWICLWDSYFISIGQMPTNIHLKWRTVQALWGWDTHARGEYASLQALLAHLGGKGTEEGKLVAILDMSPTPNLLADQYKTDSSFSRGYLMWERRFDLPQCSKRGHLSFSLRICSLLAVCFASSHQTHGRRSHYLESGSCSLWFVWTRLDSRNQTPKKILTYLWERHPYSGWFWDLSVCQKPTEGFSK